MALLDQSDAESDTEEEITLLIHSEDVMEASMPLDDPDSIGGEVADGDGDDETASVDTDGRLELSFPLPLAEGEAYSDEEAESVIDIEAEALGSGCIGTCPVGGTHTVCVEVMSTTTVVVAVIGSPRSSSPNPTPASIPIALAC